MEFILVVRKGKGVDVFEYLSREDSWTTEPNEAWCYGSITAFTHAEDFGGSVFLRLPYGREIAVERSDFWVEAWMATDPPPEDPVISAVTKEIKEAYGQGHDDGYRMALHDVEVSLNKIGQGRLGFQIRCQLANEMRKTK